MRLHDYLDYHARETPTAEFAVQGERSLTYAEALAEADRIASAFVASGLAQGDRVAILSTNNIEYLLLYFGASKSGVVLVPLNYRLAPPEWAFIIIDAEAKAIIAAGDYVGKADPILDDLEQVVHHIALHAKATGRWTAYDAWLDAAPGEAPGREVAEDDDVYQMYTSGTTGLPKGAVISHGAVAANIALAQAALRQEANDRSLMVAPVYHAAAAVLAFNTIASGASLLIQDEFVPAEVVRALSEDHIHNAVLVPAMIQACLVHVTDVAERKYPDLRWLAYGASPIAEGTLRKAMEVFGCDFIQAYGMTEATCAVTFLSAADHRRAVEEKSELLLSAGRAAVGVEIRIVDDHDQEIPRGLMGEIVVRYPGLMKRYWKRPEATEETLRGGWLHTGDAGVMDEEGFLYVQDRIKDMIVSGGENVYPREIEDVLFTHPAVADAAVIGVPDEEWGETVKAVVVCREGGESVTEEEIVEFCGDRLAGFKRPRSVDFVDVLPRNPSGKVLKRQLREPYWKGYARRVAGS